jgi:hypothetical protein
MKMRKTHVRIGGVILFGLAAWLFSLPSLPAQVQAPFNEREVKAEGLQATEEAKAGDWTLDFRFKDPRLIKVNIPARGTRICWYMWYQVINRSKEPRTIYPAFELVTLDFPGVYADEPLTTVVDAIKKIEDPTGYQDIKDFVTITANPIPVSLPADKAFPKAVSGVAIWDGTPADPKERADKTRDLSDSQSFSIFVTGLSSGFVQVDPVGTGKVAQPVIRRKTLQLNFKRVGDRFHLDARDIAFQPPAEWIYRASALPKPKSQEGGAEPMPPQKDSKKAARLSALPDLNQYVQPVIHRGN